MRYLNVGRQDTDFNGDGYADLVVGASLQSAPETREGNAFVYDGVASRTLSSPLVLDNPADEAEGQFGVSVAGAGDLDGDGYADLIVGAREHAYIYYGSSAGLSATPDLTIDNPSPEDPSGFGHAVAGAGDLNGDGYADLVVGAYLQDNPEHNEGNAFIYYGSSGGILNADTPLTLDSPMGTVSGSFGWAVASAGDVNGDGYLDVIVGAHNNSNPESNEGSAFVYYGSSSGLAASPDGSLDNPRDQPDALFGFSVGSAGDLNGDGYAEIVVGAPSLDDAGMGDGNVFVFFGGQGGVSDTDVPATLRNPTGQDSGALGTAVVSAGDLNGDGFGDLAVGAAGQSYPEEAEGTTLIYYGSASPSFDSPVTLDNPGDTAFGNFGHDVAGAGDLDGDGYADLVIGANRQSNPEPLEGNAFVFHGSAALSFEAPTTLDNPTDNSYAQFGQSVH